MKDKDAQLLAEAYVEIKEGAWNELKTRIASTPASIAGFGQKVGSIFKKGAAGRAMYDRGDSRGMNKKTSYILKLHVKNLQKEMASLDDDLKRLGLDPTNMTPTSPIAAAAITELRTALGKLNKEFGITGTVGKNIKRI